MSDKNGTAQSTPAGGNILAASSQFAQSESKESSTKVDHWVEFVFVDGAGNPVSGLAYEFTGPNGETSGGILQPDGRVKRDALPPGECKVRLLHLFSARWSVRTARVGEKVALSARVVGFRDNEEAMFHIYERDISQPDRKIAQLPASVRGNALGAEWAYPAPTLGDPDKPEAASAIPYSSPEYYFDVTLGPCIAHSPVLRIENSLDLSRKDGNGSPVAKALYVLRVPDGSLRKGQLDDRGQKREEKLPVGRSLVKFDNLSKTEH